MHDWWSMGVSLILLFICKNYLQKHAFGYDGSTDSLITGKCRRGAEGDDDEEGGGEQEEQGGSQAAPGKAKSCQEIIGGIDLAHLMLWRVPAQL